MPYIKQTRRSDFSTEINRLVEEIENKAELNYVISMLLRGYVHKKGKQYKILDDVTGTIECAKREFQRTVVDPYEKEKQELNGDLEVLS